MKNRMKGITFVEATIILVIVSLVSVIAAGAILNNRGATERRAYENSNIFIKDNGISVKRKTCAGDSNNDGYGTCNILTEDGEKIILQCPTSYFSINWFGAKSCKEVFLNLNMMQG
jgi:hypothetical protein